MSAADPASRTNYSVLVVDDEPVIRDSLSSFLDIKGWNVACAGSADEALALLKEQERPFVITDINMPGMDGLALMSEIKRERPHVEVIVMTGISTEDLAIQALRSGAADYFRKPIKGAEVEASLLRSQRMLEMRAQNENLRALVSRQSESAEQDVVLGDSPASRHMIERLRKVAAATDTTVLLVGETGVGKEVAARLLHRWSKPPDAPFVAINCGGVAEGLLERELFGHEKGAFTGADKRTPGIFEMGLDGTVLLDEITEMSFAAQSRLLRVLEERSLRRVGGTTDIGLRETRVIATTNKDLDGMVAEGSFREDLYFRLAVVPIRLPALRERREEIPQLARRFLQRMKGDQAAFSAEAEAALQGYHYPGNIRELKNVVEHAAIFSTGPQIQLSDLPPAMVADGGARPAAGTAPATAPGASPTAPALSSGSLNLREHEIALIREALSQTAGNHSACARRLGITPQALYRRMEKYGLT